jgi:hypothetical protein
MMIVLGHGSNAGEGLIGGFRREDRDRCIVGFPPATVKIGQKGGRASICTQI